MDNYLLEALIKEEVVVKALDGVEPARRKRLIELGFYTGAKLKVLQKNKNVMIVGVRGYALCVDKILAAKIAVWRAHE